MSSATPAMLPTRCETSTSGSGARSCSQPSRDPSAGQRAGDEQHQAGEEDQPRRGDRHDGVQDRA